MTVLALTLAIFAVGAVTRLTDSGLSMVEWEPIMGAVPPMSEEAWESAFFAYQQYPEFQLRRTGMTIGEFKFIFFWEYFHRLLGRTIGLVFLVPFLVFLVRGQIRGKLAGLLAFGFVLGGLQGALGWFMVKSGLQDVPYVSHYRLAAHLMLALLLFCYLFWIWTSLLPASPRREAPSPLTLRGRSFLTGLFGLLLLQIVYGAFVAGLNAGWQFNTFPKMMGRWLPPGWLSHEPLVINFFQNAATVQWMHRSLAWLLLGGGLAAWFTLKNRMPTERSRLFLDLFAMLLLVQFGLGVATLVLEVPIVLATLHQVVAVLLAAFMTGLHGELSRSRAALPGQ